MPLAYVGNDVPRVEGRDKLTGRAKFVADYNWTGMLHARVLRSACAHALIKHLDVSKAREIYGVRAIVTGWECPGPIGACLVDQYPLAREKARYFGEPVAAVIADSEEIAARAVQQIVVEYEPLPVILDPRQGAAAKEHLIHANVEDYKHIPQINPVAGTNIFHHYKLRQGDVEAAWPRAALIVENSFSVPAIQHVALEPHGAIGLYAPGEGLTMWASTQAPFIVRHTLASMFGLPLAKVRVIAPYLGGGFGGKSDVTIEPLAGCLARAVPGRPVRLVLDREEVFTGTTKGRGLEAVYKTGVDAEGRIIAEKITLYWNGGGYGDYAVNIVGACGHNATGPYAIEHICIDSYGVYTNTPPTGALRGYGHPEVHWACERQHELLAKQLGMDPVEFRRKNILRPGSKNSLGQVLAKQNGDLARCLDLVAAELQAGQSAAILPPYRRRGRGLAVLGKSPVMTTNAQSGAVMRLNDDGSATVFVGAIEMGQGTLTALAQIAAETLGLPVEMVQMAPEVDTQYSPYEWQTVASHTTWAVGQAVVKAALDARRQLLQAAAKLLQADQSKLLIQAGQIFSADEPEQRLAFRDIALGYTYPNGQAANEPVIGRGTFVPRDLEYADPATGQGNCAADWTFGCQGAEVEVDVRTGEVQVLKFITALDPGWVINPGLAANQVKGAVVQALGSSLSEQLIYGETGIMRNAGLTDYKIPTSLDIPLENKVYFVETPDKNGPYGARGLGEHGTVAVAPAVANAIADAIGVELTALPMTPDQILEGLAKEAGVPVKNCKGQEAGV